MDKLTLDVPTELRPILERHPEIRWEHIAEGALRDYARKMHLADQIASRSALTEDAAEAIGREIKASLRKHYPKGGS